MKGRIYTIALLLLPWMHAGSQNLVKDEEGNIMLPNQKGQYEIVTFYDDYYTSTLPAETVKLFENKLDEIIDEFLEHQLVSEPEGFDIRFNKRIESWDELILPNDYPIEINSKLTASLEIALSPYYQIADRPITDFHIASIVNIYLNNPYNIAGSPVMANIYPCPEKADDFHGYPVYLTNRREVTTINLSGRPVFIPVSQEEFITTLVTYWKSKMTVSISFAEDQITRLEQELHLMTPAEKKRQGYYSVDAFEDFNNVSGLLPESHKNAGVALVRVNSDLIDDGADKIQLVSIHWYLMNSEYSDSPRLSRPGNKPDLITDNKLLSLYHDKRFWERLFQIIKQ